MRDECLKLGTQLVDLVYDVSREIREDYQLVVLLKPCKLSNKVVRPELDRGNAYLIVYQALQLFNHAVLQREKVCSRINQVQEQPNRLKHKAVTLLGCPGILLLEQTDVLVTLREVLAEITPVALVVLTKQLGLC